MIPSPTGPTPPPNATPWLPPASGLGPLLGRPADQVPLDAEPLNREPGLPLGELRRMVRRMPNELCLQLRDFLPPSSALLLLGGHSGLPTEEHTTRLCLLARTAVRLTQLQTALDDACDHLPGELQCEALAALGTSAGRVMHDLRGAQAQALLDFLENRLVPAIMALQVAPEQEAVPLGALVRALPWPRSDQCRRLYARCMDLLPVSTHMLAVLGGTEKGRSFVSFPARRGDPALLIDCLVKQQRKLSAQGTRLPRTQLRGLLLLLEAERCLPSNVRRPRISPDLLLPTAVAVLDALTTHPCRLEVELVARNTLPWIAKAAEPEQACRLLRQLLAWSRSSALHSPDYAVLEVVCAASVGQIWQRLDAPGRMQVFQDCLYYLPRPHPNILRMLAGRLGGLPEAQQETAIRLWLEQCRRLIGPSWDQNVFFVNGMQSEPPAGTPQRLLDGIARLAPAPVWSNWS